MKLSDIDFRFEDLAGQLNKLGLTQFAERLRAAFRATRESLTHGAGLASVIRHNIPPTVPPTVAALPTASAQLVGQIAQLDLDGVSDDTVHICIKETGGTFAWKQFTIV